MGRYEMCALYQSGTVRTFVHVVANTHRDDLPRDEKTWE
jgi:hypothetical protein